MWNCLTLQGEGFEYTGRKEGLEKRLNRYQGVKFINNLAVLKSSGIKCVFNSKNRMSKGLLNNKNL